MKNIAFIVIIMMLISFGACEKDSVEKHQETTVGNDVEDITIKGYGGGICFYYIEYGLKWGGHCYSSFAGICEYKRICIPEIYYDVCQLIPCGLEIFDPRIIYEKIDPRDLLSFRDKLGLNIDPKRGVVPFALNEAILGLQFYEENALLTPTREGLMYRLKKDLVLDKETANKLGLRGNVIKAGEYPVIYNKENKIFNAILKVDKNF